jgi:hypothetical protein
MAIPTAQSPFLNAVGNLFDKLSEALPDGTPLIRAYIAGGTAVHWWTQDRSTHDVDAEFSRRLFIAGDMSVRYEDETGRHTVELDRQYNPSFGLAHEGYEDRASSALGMLGGQGKIEVFILAPVDLALSKLARWAEVDENDIQALARAGLLDASQLEALAKEAMVYAVGVNPSQLQHNLNSALDYVRTYTPQRPVAPRP